MRIRSIDFVKGIGIVSFIYWHSLNYFFEPGEWAVPSGRFLHYVTGLFSFLSGMIVGLHYVQKIESLKDERVVYYRLAKRAMKLFLICIAAVTANQVLYTKSFSITKVGEGIEAIGTLFYTDRWDIPLQILVVIGLVLMASLAPLWLRAKIGPSFIAVFFLSMLIIEPILNIKIIYLWHYFFVGILGCLIGINLERNWGAFCDLVAKRYRKMMIAIVVLYFAIQASVSIEKVTFSVFLNVVGPNLLSILVNVAFWGLPFFYKYDLREANKPSFIAEQLCVLGQYSLFVYIFQICILNAIRISGKLQLTVNETYPIVVSVFTAAACLTGCYLVKKFRKYSSFEFLYRSVFE